MDAYDEKSQNYLANKRAFTDFLTNDVDGVYQQRISEMVKNKETRLIVNIDDLRNFNPELARRVLDVPMQYLAPFQSALKEYVLSLNISEAPNYAFDDDGHLQKAHREGVTYTVGLDGNFGGQRVSPRQLSALHLGKLVCVEGIATRCSIVRPKVQKTVHYCEKTGAYSDMTYHDSTSISGFPTSSIYPTKDLEGNSLTTEFGLSKYQDHQSLVIQEMPERAPAGLLPSSVDVVVDDDLVDTAKPGDRVAIIGIYRALPSKSQGQTSGIFKAVLIANHIKHLGKNRSTTNVKPDDIPTIRKLARRQDVFELLGRSIAPSIFGHDFIKRALVLLLLGGTEKNLENGTHIRGDINMLFVGDPSTSKSQLLRFVLNIAPLALNTTGKGSSGVGLTAAVTQDKESGDRRLEAGAMVLADRGVVCIDEFDKMSDSDRVAIHEVMEQQTVTIAKAGIHMSLNARCSVVAAANPRYSQYDSTKPPNWNVNLPDSLLSRFDFLFIILDTPEPENDRKIAEKVLSNHRYMKKGGALENDEDENDYNTSHGGDDSEVYQKFDKLLHGGLVRRGRGGAQSLDILSIPWMKKYIEFAKELQPVLTDEAAEWIGRAYAELRQKAVEAAETKRESSFPITARTLETLIRLSTAHAKARLDTEVHVEDCEEVLKILRYAIEHDTGVKAREEAVQRLDEDEEEDAAMEDEEATPSRRSPKRRRVRAAPAEDEEEVERTPQPTPSKRARRADSATSTPKSKKGRAAVATPGSGSSRLVQSMEDVDASGAEGEAESSVPVVDASSASRGSARFQEFQKHLVAYMKRLRVESVSLNQVLTSLRERSEGSPFGELEAQSILRSMEQENLAMFRSGVIYKI